MLSAENLIASVEAEGEIVVVDGQFLIFFWIKRRQESDNFGVGGLVGMSDFRQIFRECFSSHEKD